MDRVSEQDLANARMVLASNILGSENAPDILNAMNNLTMLQAHRATDHHRKSKKVKSKKKRRREREVARAWKLVADEFYTVTMCAIYTQQDQQ